MNKTPVIGVTCHVDTGHQDDIFPGRSLNYIDRTYPDILIRNGMLPFLIPVNENDDFIVEVLHVIDGLLCTGGGKIPDYILNRKEIPVLADTAPDRYRSESKLFSKALELDLPILGICRGMQMINEVMGGTMYLKISENVSGAMEHNQTKFGKSLEEAYHEIKIEEDSHLARVLGVTMLSVNSWHSQSIKEIGRSLKVVARSHDQVIEALESEVNTFVLLTQFHPEIVVKRDLVWNKLFEEFKFQAVEKRKKRGVLK
ncbi:MAG: gamma-glutamyl-gamma-aminobutyrate hydrolase family protein [Bacillota bacterium]